MYSKTETKNKENQLLLLYPGSLIIEGAPLAPKHHAEKQNNENAS